MNRRIFLRAGAGAVAGMSLAPLACTPSSAPSGSTADLFSISLAQWSLHRSFFSVDPRAIGWDVFDRTLVSDDYRSLLGGRLDPLRFAEIARRDYGIEAVEYVNTFYYDRARDMEYLGALKRVADGEGVRSVLIMCDAEGALGAPAEADRLRTVENHYKWVEAAAFLGCHAIRVNAASDASLAPAEQQQLAADGLRRLCEFSDGHGINVIVENHGGISSNGQWLAGVMRLTDHPRAGTLPDFGNFYLGDDSVTEDIRPELWYDRYQGVQELMPYAKGVSAKSMRFDARGNEMETDFERMMRIVLDAGYHGFVGIEYEGSEVSEDAGIKATKALLEGVREKLGAA
ncbi:MAG: sugar phosphate isomerase/epimerase family protein [Rhodothermales bacterium]